MEGDTKGVSEEENQDKCESVNKFHSSSSDSSSKSDIRHRGFCALTSAKGSEIFERITEQPEY
jgi:hypothetical protein